MAIQENLLLTAAQAWGGARKQTRITQIDSLTAAKNAWDTPALPSGEPVEPNFFSALIRVAIAKKLVEPRIDKNGRERPSWADRKQAQLLRKINSWNQEQYERGILDERPSPAVIPSTENVTKHLRYILNEFDKHTSSGAVTPRKLDVIIDQQTREYVDLLWKGQRDEDNNGEPTAEEVQIAKDLTMQAGLIPATEIRQTLYDVIYGRAADIVANQKTSGLAEQQQRFDKGLSRLRAQRPKQWYTADWLTTEVMLTSGEQKLMENTTWTFTPTDFIVRSVSPKSTKDVITIPLSQMGVDYVAWNGTPKYIDALKKVARRVLQQFLDPLIQQSEIGGLTTIGSSRRSADILSIAVRNGGVVANVLMSLGDLNRQYFEGAELKTKALRGQDPKYLSPIRPTMIQKLLPDPLILEKDIERNAQGEINWRKLGEQLENERKEAEEKMKIVAARIVAENYVHPTIDENGQPSRTGDRRSLKWHEKQINQINERIEKTRQLYNKSSHKIN